MEWIQSITIAVESFFDMREIEKKRRTEYRSNIGLQQQNTINKTEATSVMLAGTKWPLTQYTYSKNI